MKIERTEPEKERAHYVSLKSMYENRLLNINKKIKAIDEEIECTPQQ